MALCLAHAAAGYLVYEALRPAGRHEMALLATAVVAANLPDADFLPGLAIGHATAFHRGFTHTLAAAIVATAVVWVIAKWGRRWGRARRPAALASVAGAAYLTHLLLDWMTVDAVPPPGIQLFWPFSDAWMHAPWNVLGEIIVDSGSRVGFVQSLLTPAAVQAWTRRLGCVAAAVALVQPGPRCVRRAHGPVHRLAGGTRRRMIWWIGYLLLLTILFVRVQNPDAAPRPPLFAEPDEPVRLIQAHHWLFYGILLGTPLEAAFRGGAARGRLVGWRSFAAGVALYRLGGSALGDSLSPLVNPRLGATPGDQRAVPARAPSHVPRAGLHCSGRSTHARLAVGALARRCRPWCVLVARAVLEDAALARTYPEYARWAARTKRLVPFVF